MDFSEQFRLILPLAIVQLSLQVYCLVHLARRPKVSRGSKPFWAVLIILGGLIGAVAYTAIGRQDS